MAATLVADANGQGAISWKMVRDENGDREYTVKHRVQVEAGEGPATVIQCPDLPQPGDEWNFGDDVDIWATCKMNATVTPTMGGDHGRPDLQFLVEQVFTTKGDEKRCKDEQIEDPLLQPPEISGSYSKYTEEATHDRYGKPILSSSHEMMRGPQVEFDANRMTVKIKQNVATNYQAFILPGLLKDTVNRFTLWGMPPRCIKMVPMGWSLKFYGQCYAYYTRELEFEIRPETFDRNLLDEGSKVLHGHWNASNGNWQLDNINGLPPDPYNPGHFDRFKDRSGENCRVILNGHGLPAEVVTLAAESLTEDPYYVAIQDNTGVALSNTSYWLQHTGLYGLWTFSETYNIGDVVVHNDVYYISKNTNTGSQLPGPNWVTLPGVTDKGQWNNLQAYEVGDRVKQFQFVPGTNNTELSGSIFVQKYNESDLLLLGIPTSF